MYYVGMDENSESTFDDTHHRSTAASLYAWFQAPQDYTGKEMRKILHKFQNKVIQILKQNTMEFQKTK
jgi:hypothetical protein